MATVSDPDEILRSTTGKDNFQRLVRLLISGGTTLLKEAFDQICPPSNLPTMLQNPATKKQLAAAKLTKPQWDCLYPSPGVYGKSVDFDVTLLFRLLRTICNLAPPASGWDALPANTDHSLAADLARIKYYRNSVYGHANQNMEITVVEFPQLWQEISDALMRIAGQISPVKKKEWQKAIDNFLKNPLTAEDERNAEELLRWYDNDSEVKQSLKEFKALTLEGMERLDKNSKSAKEELEGSIEQKGQLLENAIQEEAKDIKDHLGKEVQTTTETVQSLVREEAQNIKGELKTTTESVESVREEVQSIKNTLKEMHSTACSSLKAEGWVILSMDCEIIPGPGPIRRGSDITRPQTSVHSASEMPITSHPQHASPYIFIGGENVANADLPTTQLVLNFIAEKYFQSVDTSKPEELNGFLEYMEKVRKVLILDTHQGSLIITLQCRSLQILDELWEDYCSGHLNEVAQKYLVTEEVLEEFGLTAVKLTTTILEEEYTACRQCFLQSEVYSPRRIERESATGIGPQVETSEVFSVPTQPPHLDFWSNMEIFVLLPTGRRITLDVEPSDTIKYVKELILNWVGIHPDFQHLQLGEKQLEDDCTLSDCNIKEKSTLYLVPKYAHFVKEIFVMLPTGKKISLEVKPKTSIRDVKEKIQHKEGIPPNQQHLVFVGEALEDDRTLQNYQMASGSTIRLGLAAKQIFVKMPSGKTKTLKVKPETTIRDVKCKIQKKGGMPPDKQRISFIGKSFEDSDTLKNCHITNESTLQVCFVKNIFVKMPFGKTVALEIEPDSSVKDVIDTIQRKEGIPLDQHHLEFRNEILEDDRTLESYDIANKSTLLLSLAVKQIFVKMPDGTISLNVKPETSVRDVKRKIHEKEGIPPDQQHLVFRGEALEDGRTLREYHIANSSTLHFGLDVMQIFIEMTSGKKITLEVKPETKIREVKYKIQEIEGIPPDQQRIFVNGNRLEEYQQHLVFRDIALEDHVTLKNSHIEDKSTLRLEVVAKQMFIQIPGGKRITLEVKPETTISDIKIKIQEKEGIPSDQQRLIFNLMELSDQRTVWHYDIPNEAILHLRQMQIYVVLPTGKKITLDVLPGESVKILKEKIYEKEGIAPDQQKLTFYSKQLEYGCSLTDYNIREGSVLLLKPTAHATSDFAIFVKMPNEKTMTTVNVARSDTIKSVKWKIMDEGGIPADQQQLVYKDILLKDNYTVTYYNIEKESILQLNLRQPGDDMQLFVTTPTEKTVITLDVLSEDNVETVKRKIRDEVGIPIDHQQLTFKEEKLEDDHTLNDYNICYDSTLHLALRWHSRHMRLSVKTLTKNTVITLDAVREDTIHTLKGKIRDEVGIPVDLQELTYGEKKLQDDYTLNNYNIWSDSTLHLALRCRDHIFVKTPTEREVIKLDVVPEDTIRSVKRKVMDGGISIDQQQLTFTGRTLQDGHTLEDYNICSGSTLSLRRTYTKTDQLTSSETRHVERRSSREEQGCFLQ